MIFRILIRGFSSSAGRVRVRFAPSPTGQLHLGGLRTALINYIFAKKSGGDFLLRIEDTDRTRLVPGAAVTMESTLNWMGIFPDESPAVGGEYGPYFQSQRLNKYQEAAEKLVDNGSAYRCFCSEDRLMVLRQEALKNRQTPKYDGKCRSLTESDVSKKIEAGLPYVIRLWHKKKPIEFEDLVFGSVTHDISQHEGDTILLKSDKFPTYHLANVVDDHHMQISHVLRGEEWLMATVKHLQLYQGLEWSPPLYGHFPLLTNLKGAKLSKRHGDVFVESYKDAGYFPLALLNFLTRMGGGFGDRDEHEVLSIRELTEKLDLGDFGKHRLKVDFAWLNAYNRKILDSTEVAELVPLVQELVAQRFGESVRNLPPDLNILDPKFVGKAVEYALPRISTLKDILSDSLLFFWSIPTSLEGVEKFYSADDSVDILGDLRKALEGIGSDKYETESLGTLLRSFAENRQLNFATFMHFLRFVMSGVSVGPPVAEIFQLLGQKVVISRFEFLMNRLVHE